MRHFGDHAPETGAHEPADHASPSPQSRTSRRPRNRGPVLLCALLAIGGSSAIAYGLVAAPAPPPQPTAAQAGTLHPGGTRHPGTTASPTRMPASPPTRVRIPSIDVNAAVDALGLNPDGTVEVPGRPDDAGWYSGSPTPGRIGAAVLLGHVDFVKTGPAVFYRLGELKPGAEILVARKDGSTARFTVDAVREFLKSDFPTDEVYGPTDGTAQLRLITCGDWDSDQGKYIGNTVVFATLGKPEAAGTPATPATSATPATPAPQTRAGEVPSPR